MGWDIVFEKFEKVQINGTFFEMGWDIVFERFEKVQKNGTFFEMGVLCSNKSNAFQDASEWRLSRLHRAL